ncbi:MAG: MgtC/SapB family protein, partial [Thermoanaerobaculia bacterium]|nr:MgtC/SapB family protein [Thermoanaerobaculia bacterium]
MTPSLPFEELPRLLVAALGGLAVGVEREWSARAEGGVKRFAGVRTFLLLGLVGGLAAQLSAAGGAVAGAGLLGAAALLVGAS